MFFNNIGFYVVNRSARRTKIGLFFICYISIEFYFLFIQHRQFNLIFKTKTFYSGFFFAKLSVKIRTLENFPGIKKSRQQNAVNANENFILNESYLSVKPRLNKCLHTFHIWILPWWFLKTFEITRNSLVFWFVRKYYLRILKKCSFM